MSRTDNELSGVTLLGCNATKYPDKYAPEVLETFKNKHPENEYLVTFTCPEFTSLCPTPNCSSAQEEKHAYPTICCGR